MQNLRLHYGWMKDTAYKLTYPLFHTLWAKPPEPGSYIVSLDLSLCPLNWRQAIFQALFQAFMQGQIWKQNTSRYIKQNPK